MSIRTTKMQKIRRRIRDSIRIAKQRGYSIVTGETLNQARGCCCPLAAVYVASKRLTPNTPVNNPESALTAARRALRLKESDINRFIDGFDGGKCDSATSQYEKFGIQLREELDTGLL